MNCFDKGEESGGRIEWEKKSVAMAKGEKKEKARQIKVISSYSVSDTESLRVNPSGARLCSQIKNYFYFIIKIVLKIRKYQFKSFFLKKRQKRKKCGHFCGFYVLKAKTLTVTHDVIASHENEWCQILEIKLNLCKT